LESFPTPGSPAFRNLAHPVRLRCYLAGLLAALAWSCETNSLAILGLGPAEPLRPFIGPYALSLTASASCGQPGWSWTWGVEGTGSGAHSLLTLPGGDGRVTVKLSDLMSVLEPRTIHVVLDLERAPTDRGAYVTFSSIIDAAVVPPGNPSRVSGSASGVVAVWDPQTLHESGCSAVDHAWELRPR
jgi:hypothetical protein